MKKLFLAMMFPTALMAQVEGTWKLAQQAGALGVGPNKGDISWWSSSPTDLTTRACLFDDSITFNTNGEMLHYMDGSTWVEVWQGVGADGCGAPVAPHDGSGQYTWSFDATQGTLTVNGLGAHMGLAKVINGAEINNPNLAASSITYEAALSNNNQTLTLDINFGGGYWRFVYDKTTTIPVPQPKVTFRVDMSEYTGSTANGVFLNGEMNGWCGACAPMVNTSGSVWELQVDVPTGPVQYKFTVDGWADQENFVGGEVCVDTVNDGFFNRVYDVTGDAVLDLVCFNSCAACNTSGLEGTKSTVQVYPNPAQDWVSVRSDNEVVALTVVDVTGRVVATASAASLHIAHLTPGVYQVVVEHTKGSYSTTLIKR